jgi:hypothetical protein
MDWIEDGTYVIVVPVEDTWQCIAYSKVYRRISDYWITNPNDRLDNESWLMVKRVDGENVVIRANPHSPVIGCSHLKTIYVEV